MKQNPKKEILTNWITKASKYNDKQLLKIEFRKKNKFDQVSIVIHLIKELGLTRDFIEGYKYLLKPIEDMIMKSKYYNRAYEPKENKYRFKIYNEYLSMSNEEILINFSKYTDRSSNSVFCKVFGFRIHRLDKTQRELINITLNEIKSDLVHRGCLRVRKPNISNSKNKNKVKKAEDKNKTYLKLSKTPINTVNDILKNNKNDLLMSFKHIYCHSSAFNSSNITSSRVSFDNKIGKYIIENFNLKEVNFYTFFDRFSLVSYYEWVKRKIELPYDKGGIKAVTGNDYIYTFRKILIFAIKIDGMNLDFFHGVRKFRSGRSDITRKPFNRSIRDELNAVINNEINRIDYFKHIYEYPELIDSTKIPTIEKNLLKYIKEEIPNGFALRNAESSYNFTQLCKQYANLKDYDELTLRDFKDKFFIKHHILEDISAYTVFPYLCKLAQITGMNVTPLIELEIDDFCESHPITSKPALYYWKNRSSGGKILYLDIFDADIRWLSISQAVEVKKIFDKVTRITQGIRDYAPPSIKNRLFIFRNRRNINNVNISCFDQAALSRSSSHYVSKWKLFDGDEQLQLNLARFRPTLVSELVEADVSLREIQLILGHKSIATTIQYLDSHDFDDTASKKVHRALKTVHKNSIMAVSNRKVVKDVQKRESETTTNIPTFLVECMNVLEPPEFIKSHPSFVEGKPCALHNMCLGCDNVLITRDHLPRLFALSREYIELIKQTHISKTPYYSVIKENIELLDEILNPDKSDFDRHDLAIAEKLSWNVPTNNGAGL